MGFVRHEIGLLFPRGLRRHVREAEWRARLAMGFSTPIHSEDRRVLERIILPYFNRDQKILLVGCDSYTRHYPRLLEKAEVWTLEPDKSKQRWGATRHIVDVLENLSWHISHGYFDAILCNGVFGWGLNDWADCETAFKNCFDALKEGGLLIIGWNDVPEHRPLPLESLKSIQEFERWKFPPLQSDKYVTATQHRHVYNFYRRP